MVYGAIKPFPQQCHSYSAIFICRVFYFPYGINIRFAVGCVRRRRNASSVPGDGVICGVEPFFMYKNGGVRGNVSCKYYFIMMASAQ